MVDEELRARIISRAKMKLGKMKELSVLEAVTLLEHIEELESRPTPLAPDGETHLGVAKLPAGNANR